MAQQVRARIVLSQAGVGPPVGYVAGSRGDLEYDGPVITATNADNAGVIRHEWKLEPFAPSPSTLTAADFAETGTSGATYTATPPADGWGDHILTLTVYGDPLPGGKVNVSIDKVVLGIAKVAATAGVPDIRMPHPREGGPGELATIDPSTGRYGTAAELAYVVGKLDDAVALGGGGGGSLPGGTGTVRVDSGVATAPDYVKFGTNPAASGAVRLPKAGVVASRNHANSGDLHLIGNIGVGGDKIVAGDNSAPLELRGSTITLQTIAVAGMLLASAAGLVSSLAPGTAGREARSNGTQWVAREPAFYTPESLGAAGDGTTDDRAIIQAAISSGKSIWLSAGTVYALGASLTLPDDTVLAGHGKLVTTALDELLTVTGDRVRILGIELEGDAGTLPYSGGDLAQKGISITGKYHVLIDGVRIRNVKGAGVYVLNTNTDTAYSGVQIVGCEIHASTIGIHADTTGEYVTHSGCKVLNCFYGAWVVGGNFNGAGTQITASAIGVILGPGSNNSHGVMSGCTINHSSVQAILVQSGVTLGYTFSGCAIYYGDIDVSGVGIRFVGCQISDLSGIKIRTGCSGLAFVDCMMGTSPTVTDFSSGAATASSTGCTDLAGAPWSLGYGGSKFALSRGTALTEGGTSDLDVGHDDYPEVGYDAGVRHETRVGGDPMQQIVAAPTSLVANDAYDWNVSGVYKNCAYVGQDFSTGSAIEDVRVSIRTGTTTFTHGGVVTSISGNGVDTDGGYYIGGVSALAGGGGDLFVGGTDWSTTSLIAASGGYVGFERDTDKAKLRDITVPAGIGSTLFGLMFDWRSGPISRVIGGVEAASGSNAPGIHAFIICSPGTGLGDEGGWRVYMGEASGRSSGTTVHAIKTVPAIAVGNVGTDSNRVGINKVPDAAYVLDVAGTVNSSGGFVENGTSGKLLTAESGPTASTAYTAATSGGAVTQQLNYMEWTINGVARKFLLAPLPDTHGPKTHLRSGRGRRRGLLHAPHARLIAGDAPTRRRRRDDIGRRRLALGRPGRGVRHVPVVGRAPRLAQRDDAAGHVRRDGRLPGRARRQLRPGPLWRLDARHGDGAALR